MEVKRAKRLPTFILNEDTKISENLILLGFDVTGAVNILRRRKDVGLINFGEIIQGVNTETVHGTEPIVAIENYDYRADDESFNHKRLELLERLRAQRPSARIVIVTTIDPVFHYRVGSDGSDSPVFSTLTSGGDADRWTRALIGFTRKRLPGEFSCATPERCRVVWSTCTVAERIALYQLAHDGWVNPKNEAALTQLQRRNLIRHIPFNYADDGLRKFIAKAIGSQDQKSWQKQDEAPRWEGIRLTFVVLLSGLVAAILFFNQQTSLGVILTGLGVLTPITKLLSEAESLRSLLGLGVKDVK